MSNPTLPSSNPRFYSRGSDHIRLSPSYLCQDIIPSFRPFQNEEKQTIVDLHSSQLEVDLQSKPKLQEEYLSKPAQKSNIGKNQQLKEQSGKKQTVRVKPLGKSKNNKKDKEYSVLSIQDIQLLIDHRNYSNIIDLS